MNAKLAMAAISSVVGRTPLHCPPEPGIGHFTWRRFAAGFAVAAALAACGGGSSSPAATGAGPSYSVQRYAANALTRHADIAYSERPNRDGSQITTDLEGVHERGSPRLTLHMEVLVPPDATTASPRPLLIWIHGGGLVAGNKETIGPYAEAWSRAGYVTANIDYRLTPRLAGDALLHTSAVMDATEDLTSAIRYLRSHASQYAIDAGRMATIGYSSAGEVVMAQAIEPASLPGTAPDQPAVSGQVQGAISTGATLVNRFWDSDALLTYQATDTPVLLMHLRPVDPVTQSTWDANVLPTAARINDSGNVCITYEHTNGQHMADLNFGSPDFPAVDAFLRLHLRLP